MGCNCYSIYDLIDTIQSIQTTGAVPDKCRCCSDATVREGYVWCPNAGMKLPDDALLVR